MKLNAFDLKQDPFPIVPDGPVHNWAGRDELREELVDLVKGVRARDIGVTEFAVLHGELGAGKSHALRYLKTMVDNSKDDFKSIAIYIERPRVATKLNFLELYKYIMRYLGRGKFEALCEELKSKVDELAKEAVVPEGLDSAPEKTMRYETAIAQFPAHDRPMLRLLYRGAVETPQVFEFMCGNMKCDGDEYEGKIDSDFIASKVLADFFRVLMTEFKDETYVVESVYLFIDEGEVLFDAKTSESDLVFNGIRELINGLPYKFCLVISFSAATALLEAVMPQHLLKRLTRNYIEVPMLDDDEALKFLKAQINYFRTDESEHADTYYPFSQESVEFIISDTTSLTPRNLFIDCKRVLERAIRRFDLQPGDEIDLKTTEKILEGYR
ncbi:ATP-binding protein [Actibacterium sp. XHP0104]|uniref:ATP-binding protein n=1 Tax=Actibacterium sp. XHP0104 TaxID=2984335 RepID=UPI0021E8FBC4|nr:ATP-binding protein [Actibacterium sp. XHP0104]MCV2881890.1 ATP-binding protein [Actibacterium sp. XHP0104]